MRAISFSLFIFLCFLIPSANAKTIKDLVDSSEPARPSDADPHEARAKPAILDSVLTDFEDDCNMRRQEFARKYPQVNERRGLTCQCFRQALLDDGRLNLARAAMKYVKNKKGQPPLHSKNRSEQAYFEQVDTLQNYCVVDASWSVKEKRPPLDYNRKMQKILIQMGVVKNPSRF